MRAGLLFLSLLALAGGAFLSQPWSVAADNGGQTQLDPFWSWLKPDARRRAELGEVVFQQVWTAAPARDTTADGLGPLYNATACAACHNPATPADAVPVLRISGANAAAHPVYGRQIQDHGTPGVAGEGVVRVDFTPVLIKLPDGRVVELRAPVITINAPAYGDPGPGLLKSLREARNLSGVGIFSAVPGAAILAHADPDDRDGDGVSGRPHFVVDRETGARRIGRFGWKAAMPSLEEQAADAFALDMGLDSPRRPGPAGDCTKQQRACMDAVNGVDAASGHEVSEGLVRLVADYVAALARPSGTDGINMRGKAVFYTTGCAECHVPTLPIEVTDGPIESSAYTDLLLHDMGAGLADGRPENNATGVEWRTAPLIGLAQRLNRHGADARLLHDGRARTIEEAILWHDGEARASRDKYLALRPSDRMALVAFLERL